MMHNNPSDWRAAAEETPPTPSMAQPAASRRRSGGRQASVAATLLAVAVFGGLIGFAADRWLSATPNPVAAQSAGAPTAGSAQVAAAPTVGSVPRVGPVAAPNGAADNAQQTIQQVVESGDQEQAQAFGNNDPTVMQDTSTADFYRQQVQTNQDLKTNGVSAIKLIGIDWGQITVNGSSATATAWETWSTTYADGTTQQSRDRNVYTLVLDNGIWKVSDDQHPDDALASGGEAPGVTTPGGQGNGDGSPPASGRQPGTRPQPAQPSQPLQPTPPRAPRGQGDTSQNWSGYAATGGTYTAVNGTWTVPAFTPDSTAGADAAWVGIGGVNSRDLIQAGTQQSVSGTGSTQYEAWVETLPQASHPVPLTVHPGDSVTISIAQQPQATDQWLVAFKNNTTGQMFQVTETYSSSMSSVEWIEEAPSSARGRQMALDNFGSINFSASSAVKDGSTVSIADAGGKAITMIDRTGQRLATPSALGSDGASFSVARN